MLSELLAALAIVVILEGVLPLASPKLWRETFRRLLELSDGQIRFVGLIAIAVGLAGLLLVRNA